MNKYLINILLMVIMTIPATTLGQKTQSIRGQVINSDTQAPLRGVEVSVSVDDKQIGAITDQSGKFHLKEVPIGRRVVQCRYPGFATFSSPNMILTSAKEQYLEVELQESIGETKMDEVVIYDNSYPTQASNELSVVSTRSFNAEITGRIPAAVNDPSRMALAFPGVQQGGDDSENDIIIRGNSSMGMLWRLEGLDIPTPNHFGRPGTSGGGLTVFSAQLIDRSDFSTGGMPAEYGNALSGVMDVNFRKGNLHKRENRAKIGVLGLDFATEGPIKKGKSSYLANYRYSTLSILNRFGFNLVGERVDNDFQDLSFNLAFEGKEGKSFTTVFGMGGLSLEHYRPIPEVAGRGLGDDFRGNEWEDRRQGSNMMAIGMTHLRNIDDKSYIKISLAGTAGFIFRYYDVLDTLNNASTYRDEEHNDRRGILALVYNRKLSSRTKLRTGIFAHQIFYKFYRESTERADLFNLNLDNIDVSANGEGQTQTFQTFAQVSHQLNEQVKINAGAHFYLLGLNGKSTLDPRLSLVYNPLPKTTISFAYGIHSQILPLMMYFYYDQDQQIFPNRELPMMRSHHGILSLTQIVGSGLKLSAEFYAQRLFQIPVLRGDDGNWNDTTTFWLLNQRESAFNPFVSQGAGWNYGVDLAMEKTFNNGLYFLLTGSFFDSKFELPDGQLFNSRFASKWVSSYTLGKEFYFRNSTLQIGARVLYNGGFRYTPADIDASITQERYVADETRLWEGQVNPYFRIDSRIAWFWNSKKISGYISLDIQNLTDRRNPRNIGWDSQNNMEVFSRHPSGLIPVLSFQFDF
ncbi:MAG: TonB-dependent receptor [Bacteroidia bacterium]|nr:TonB-dependent receptor [Bacteroidia bacterium]